MNAAHLTDKAFDNWALTHPNADLETWREARRRSIERELLAFQEGWEACCETYPHPAQGLETGNQKVA